ncbi:hypothetical protein C8R43DRAFT_440543 [Mycena crocata]|nr:hypothetical protein C8R43DRAFT_440543 [Mycena crocata]
MAPIRDCGTKAFVDDVQLTLYLTMAEGILYGAYAVLFGCYLHVLRTRRIWSTHRSNQFLAVATITLFILCTAHLALLLACIPLRIRADEAFALGGEPQSHACYIEFEMNRTMNVMYVTSNVIADSIFIFRCYAIWNFQRKIIVVPLLSTLAVAGLGYFDSGRLTSIVIITFLFDLSIAVSLFTTILLMGLSAGRIWWLARQAQDVLGRRVTDKYYTVVAMILESGALYCLGGIAFIIVAFREASSTNPVITSGAVLGQLVGIAPTILAVRVGLGKSVDSVDSYSRTVQAHSGRARPREIQLCTISSAHFVEPRISESGLRPEGGNHDGSKVPTEVV